MIIKLLLVLVGAVGVYSKGCVLRSDTYSPFYWRKTADVCTEDLCTTYPWLPCGVSKEYILDQAAGHYPEDILAEIEYLGKYFNTYLPKPNNMLPYTCTDVCQTSAKQLQLQRIFSDINIMNYNTGMYETQRHMCIVIGPDIYYQQCGGQCQMPYGSGRETFCVPDVHVSMDIWVYCPDIVETKCHKVRFDVPVSCSCKKVTCKGNAKLPPYVDIKPNVPPKPAGWHPGMNRYPLSALKKPTGPVDPKFNPNGQPDGPFVPIEPIEPFLPGVLDGGIPLGPMQPVELMPNFGNGHSNVQGGPHHGGNKPGHAPMHIV